MINKTNKQIYVMSIKQISTQHMFKFYNFVQKELIIIDFDYVQLLNTHLSFFSSVAVELVAGQCCVEYLSGHGRYLSDFQNTDVDSQHVQTNGNQSPLTIARMNILASEQREGVHVVIVFMGKHGLGNKKEDENALAKFQINTCIRSLKELDTDGSVKWKWFRP